MHDIEPIIVWSFGIAVIIVIAAAFEDWIALRIQLRGFLDGRAAQRYVNSFAVRAYMDATGTLAEKNRGNDFERTGVDYREISRNFVGYIDPGRRRF